MNTSNHYFVMKDQHNVEFHLDFQNVVFVKIEDNLLKVQLTEGRSFYKTQTLKSFLEAAPAGLLLPINRNIALNTTLLKQVPLRRQKTSRCIIFELGEETHSLYYSRQYRKQIDALFATASKPNNNTSN